MRTPRLDPDAAARVAAFGPQPPMRVRGLAAVRAGLESTPHPDMPAMASIDDLAASGPAGPIRFASTGRPPSRACQCWCISMAVGW